MESSFNYTVMEPPPLPFQLNDHWTLEEIELSKTLFESFPEECPKLLSVMLTDKSEAQVLKRYNELKVETQLVKEPEFVQSKPKHKRDPKSRWTENEHRKFLDGLAKHGIGHWRSIARDMGTKTSKQVASHAQKYFIRRESENSNATKKRKSIHDITFSALLQDDTRNEQVQQQSVSQVSDQANLAQPVENEDLSSNIQPTQQSIAEALSEQVNHELQQLQLQMGTNDNPIVVYHERPGLEGYYDFEDIYQP